MSPPTAEYTSRVSDLLTLASMANSILLPTSWLVTTMHKREPYLISASISDEGLLTFLCNEGRQHRTVGQELPRPGCCESRWEGEKKQSPVKCCLHFVQNTSIHLPWPTAAYDNRGPFIIDRHWKLIMAACFFRCICFICSVFINLTFCPSPAFDMATTISRLNQLDRRQRHWQDASTRVAVVVKC